jgi:diguanylate cyclase
MEKATSQVDLSNDVARRVVEAHKRHRWSAPDPVLLAMLASKNAAANRHNVRWGMAVAVVSYIAYGVFDVFLFPDVAGQLVLTRVALGLLFIAILEVAIRLRSPVWFLHAVAATAIVVGSVGWLAVASQTIHQIYLSYFIIFGIVFIFGGTLYFNFRLWVSITVATSVTLAYCAYIFQSEYISSETKLILISLFTNCLVVALYLSWRLGVERYRAFINSLRAQLQEQAAIEKGNELIEIAYTDPLTGLKNRRAIQRAFAEMRQDWAQSDDEIGLILVDVDHFKRYNDHLGHQAGDECLMILSKALSELAASRGAVAGRYGGEEFIVLCRIAGKEELTEFSQLICTSIEELGVPHPDYDGNSQVVTISAGASITQSDKSGDFDILLQEADRALYVSKFAGRARSTIFEPSLIENDRSSENLAIVLRSAISKGLVSVVYQPIVDGQTQSPVGYETLMRLSDFEGRNITPAVFIPIAERTGAIIDLGLWVLEQACRDFRDVGLGSFVGVNVSAVQLREPSFPLRVSEIVARHELAPHQLVIEITESEDVVSEAQAVRSIQQIRGLGVQVWLDDFGAGFAGLAWLRHFSFDVVKIDRSFLHDCHTAKGLRMLEDMVRLLRNSGHRVLIEGVETREQQRLLKRLRVDLMQGFLFGAPAAAASRHGSGPAGAPAGRVRLPSTSKAMS